ncbi:MAG: TonB-dependent receptor plug domain-containing protein [Candidatus Sulfopaludibacter sp.]|nr:TonB-dependent receptor plug domain-containing protein [Candidatus Sulfopaludibacter sp.]
MAIRFLALLVLACAVAAQSGEKPADEQVLFGDLPGAEAASLHAQTLAEAPAQVTVIAAERTRFLAMLNGHPLTDNIYNSIDPFGQDFGLDLDLVEHIEIIHGPTSALYGSNGMPANIDVVTRSPVDSPKPMTSAETDTFGEAEATVSSSVYPGGGANLPVSESGARSSGPWVADGERAYDTFANLIRHNWSLTAYGNSRALSEVQSRKPAAPVYAALLLRASAADNVAGRVDLEVALSTQLVVLRALFPHRARVGIIRNPLENRPPVVGVSPAFVRAGAVEGIHPDYREAGRQAAELALRVMHREEAVTGESPAKVRVAVNERVARLLGIEFGAAPFPWEVFR